MHRIEILLVSALVAFASGTNSSQFANWQSSWIQGGSEVIPGEFPYMVSVHLEGIGHFCGGAIISKWYVLTAAHCVFVVAAPSVTVKAGTTKLALHGQTYAVSRIVVYDTFDISTLKHDIALLKLMVAFVYSLTIQPIPLPFQSENPFLAKVCEFTGWGYLSSTASTCSKYLRKLPLLIISSAPCRNHYKNFFSSSQICASAVRGKGLCQRDSGGPLVCAGKLRGIASSGGKPNTPGAADYPNIFIKVSRYVRWIKENAL